MKMASTVSTVNFRSMRIRKPTLPFLKMSTAPAAVRTVIPMEHRAGHGMTVKESELKSMVPIPTPTLYFRGQK